MDRHSYGNRSPGTAPSGSTIRNGLLGAGGVCLLVVVVVAAGAVGAAGAADTPTANDGNATLEDEYVEPAPQRGDEYFEAAADDGSWISYVNPRDRYRSPYLGEGSGKLCVALLNREGEVVAGESVPNTTVTVPTGANLSWHADADPMTVEYPLTERYERPLDSDQFGTDPDLPQGDGYMDAHCIEFHGLAEKATVTYGEARVDGEHADRVTVVGYLQRGGQAWDSDVDPLADVEPYAEAGGGWTYEPGASHGQAVVVLRLDPSARTAETPTSDRSTDGRSANATAAWDPLTGRTSLAGGLAALVGLLAVGYGGTRRLRR